MERRHRRLSLSRLRRQRSSSRLLRRLARGEEQVHFSAWPGEREREGRVRREGKREIKREKVSCLRWKNLRNRFRKTVAPDSTTLRAFLSPPPLHSRIHAFSHLFVDGHDRDRGIGSSRGLLLEAAAVVELLLLLRRLLRHRIGVVDDDRSVSSSFGGSSLRARRGRRPLPELLERRGRHLGKMLWTASPSASARTKKKKRESCRSKKALASLFPRLARPFPLLFEISVGRGKTTKEKEERGKRKGKKKLPLLVRRRR